MMIMINTPVSTVIEEGGKPQAFLERGTGMKSKFLE